MTIKRELARVEAVQAHYMPDGSRGQVLIAVSGKKPTPCHIVDIDPVRTLESTFAVAWWQDSEFCVTREVPFSYHEAFPVTARPSEIVLLCAGSDGKPDEKRIPVSPLEHTSFRRLQARSDGSSLAGAAPVGVLPAIGFPFAPLNSFSPFGRVPSASPAGPQDRSINAVSNAPATQVGGVDFTFWAGGYSKCKFQVPSGPTLLGEGGALPGGGAYTGTIFANDLDRVYRETTSVAFATFLFYATATFFNIQGFDIGQFHGGGVGVGAGGFKGSWI